MRYTIALILSLLVSPGSLLPAAAQTDTLSSTALSAQMRAGQIVRLTHRQTGETLVITPTSDRPLSGMHRMGEPQMTPESVQRMPGGANRSVVHTAIWRDTSGGLRARMRTRFAIEQRTGDLLITQEGEAVQKGLYGISWGIAEIPDRFEVLVPGSSGLRFGADAPPGARLFDYPLGWESAFVLLQGRRGGFLIRADDPDHRFKNLILEKTRQGFRMRFESRNLAPFEPKSRIVSSRWRITAYRGNWQNGAALYRRWMQTRLKPQPLSQIQPAWVRQIRFVVTMNLDRALLADLAKRCNPKQTLLYLPNWRKDEYDRNYPDYTASPDFEPFVKEAHRLGFRVMPHVNYFGCDAKHPLYERFKPYHMRDPLTKVLQWWQWPADPPIKFAYINPASRAWRKLFVERMVEVYRKYRVDALHLDQTMVILNDDNGVIDGMNCMEGNLALHRQLREALPQVALSGEGLNEITGVYEAFAQRHLLGINSTDRTWSRHLIAMAHPISSAVLAPYTHLYGYLGYPNPEETPFYVAYQQGYERFGVLPTYAWPSREQMATPSLHLQQLMQMARLFQQTLPVPDFDTPWDSGDRFVYRLADGRRAAYRQDQGIVFAVRERSGRQSVVWRRIEGVASAEVSGSIPGWLAYDAKRIFGLDPQRSYPWSPAPRSLTTLHLAALPQGFHVSRAGSHRLLARFTLDSRDRGGILRLWEYNRQVEGGVRLADGTEQRYEGLAFEDTQTGASASPDVDGFTIHPPWKANGITPPNASQRTLTFLEYRLPLPDNASILFSARVRLGTGAPGLSDGITFRVIADDGARQKSAETHYASSDATVLTLDLSEFRGRAIRLRIEADPGPKGDPSYDWGRIEQPSVQIRSEAPPTPQTLLLRGLQRDTWALAAQGEAEITRIAPDACRVRLPLPNTLTLAFGEPAPVALPFDLLKTAWHSCLLLPTGIEAPASKLYMGAVVESACQGVKRSALMLHPPPDGRSIADYWLHLPARPLRLTTAIGLADGSRSNGVEFVIAVNGREIFRRLVLRDSGWIPVEVDLSGWAGKPIVLSLITDAQGDYNFDWAVWGEPKLIPD
jgi:hypothetical protein